MSIRIVVDERERNSRIPDLLRQAGVHVDVYQLKVGDYIISSTCAIERKTVRDLLYSVYDGRLFSQCFDLANNYTKPIVIVEGSILELLESDKNEEDSDNTNSVKEITEEKIELVFSAISNVILSLNVSVLHSPNSDYTSKLLIDMAKTLKEKRIDGPFIKRIRKGNQEYLQQLSILCSLPGVGNKLAIKMLERFHTPQKALNASIAELSKIPGFGSSRAEKIRKVLDQPTKIDNVSQKKLFD